MRNGTSFGALTLALALSLAGLVAAAGPASASGKVGPIQFPTAAVSCTYSADGLASLQVAAPRAKARAKWVRSRYHGQSVVYNTTLLGLTDHKWVTVSTSDDKSTIVRKRWSTLKSPTGFTTQTGLARSFDAFQVQQTVRWFKPSTGYREGVSSRTLTSYQDGQLTVGSCVRAHPTIRPSALPAATIGLPYSATPVADGVGPFTWNVTGGSLPGGLSLSPAGTLAGKTPVAPGTYPLTLTATDPNQRTASQTYQLNLNYAPGDINGDGVDDCADLAVLSAHYEQQPPVTHADGDLNGDGVVNYLDLSGVASYNNHYACEVAVRDTASLRDPIAQTGPGQVVLSDSGVAVACRLQTAASARNPDGWWYRLQTAPWNGEYYAPTNQFTNRFTSNTSTSTVYDSSVPVCP